MNKLMRRIDFDLEEKLVTQHGPGDWLWHARYPTAERTLCGKAAAPLAHLGPAPTCASCAATAAVFDAIDGSAPLHWLPPEPVYRAGARWTRETSLAAVRAFVTVHERPPGIHFRDTTVPSPPTARDLFGSWANMIQAAGFARPNRGTRYPAKVAA